MLTARRVREPNKCSAERPVPRWNRSLDAPRQNPYERLVVEPYENAEHRALADWLDRRGLFWEHVPVGGKRSKKSGQQMRAMGARAGSPDFRIYDRVGTFIGAAVELKRERSGRASPAQTDFLTKLERRGWACTVAHGADEAIAWLVRLGY